MYEDVKKMLITSFNVMEEDFHDGASLTDLGLDSLDLVELAMQLETLGAKVTDDELADAPSLEAVVALLENRSQGATHA
ncbi:MAG: acyl carrier protein [Streptomyces sp.]|uniref:acyl carrier protein n=1 Tax=unclassified Streptomyces TaxID=2593676 RepID=UPI0025DB6911|nr:phosphopantetheine-binding protein [Streptomyces sp.]MBW8792501.1 acyl carrier protein [Streptomyces sp.]